MHIAYRWRDAIKPCFEQHIQNIQVATVTRKIEGTLASNVSGVDVECKLVTAVCRSEQGKKMKVNVFSDEN